MFLDKREPLNTSYVVDQHFDMPSIGSADMTQVCGGGNAGLAIGSRLSENPSISVAVIEAGGFYELDNGFYSEVPGLCKKNSIPVLVEDKIVDSQPLIDWGLIIEPQKVSLLLPIEDLSDPYSNSITGAFATLPAKRWEEGQYHLATCRRG